MTTFGAARDFGARPQRSAPRRMVLVLKHFSLEQKIVKGPQCLFVPQKQLGELFIIFKVWLCIHTRLFPKVTKPYIFY